MLAPFNELMPLLDFLLRSELYVTHTRNQDEDEEHSSLVGISKAQAVKNYAMAGTLVPDPHDDHCEEKYAQILTTSACRAFEVASSVFPYTPVNFQKIGACALFNGHHLALRIGTGEGKMTVPLLAAKMMSQSGKTGKVVVTQPLD